MTNVVRVSLQGLAAVLGGAQSLHTNGWDEALALPSEGAAKLALRTQQVIAYETGVADTVDALGGSYHLEYLTDELEAKALASIEKIDALGGMVRAIEQGFPQQEIQNSAYEAQRAQENGELVVIGVNKFQQKEPAITGLLRIDESVGREQEARLKDLRATRSNDSVRVALDALKKHAATADENLIPLILDAVKAEATLGEIADAMRGVFGEHREHVVL
jgi:methylmalonyl-CoA mutase N-terminal domain/subunit